MFVTTFLSLSLYFQCNSLLHTSSNSIPLCIFIPPKIFYSTFASFHQHPHLLRSAFNQLLYLNHSLDPPINIYFDSIHIMTWHLSSLCFSPQMMLMMYCALLLNKEKQSNLQTTSLNKIPWYYCNVLHHTLFTLIGCFLNILFI